MFLLVWTVAFLAYVLFNSVDDEVVEAFLLVGIVGAIYQVAKELRKLQAVLLAFAALSKKERK